MGMYRRGTEHNCRAELLFLQVGDINATVRGNGWVASCGRCQTRRLVWAFAVATVRMHKSSLVTPAGDQGVENFAVIRTENVGVVQGAI
jgi:hypothetical protein